MEFKHCDNIAGTKFFWDTVKSTVAELVKVFGYPECCGDDECETQYEWNLSYNEIPFSIYDWKEYHIIKKNEEINWHIGARNEDESKMITKLVKEALKNGVNNS